MGSHSQMITAARFPSAGSESIGHTEAVEYVVSRMRVRSPLGAAEYLLMKTDERLNGTFQQRVELSDALMGLYRDLFKLQFAASPSAPFSTAREHELYRLIDRHLFPIDTTILDQEPEFFYPAIPIEGVQEHDWERGCCRFRDLQLVFQIVLTLIGARPDGWRSLGLPMKPADPLQRVGWSHFIYSCRTEPSPLCRLPLAFYLVNYKTGNVWLDTPRGERGWTSWSRENMGRLFIARGQAQDYLNSVVGLNLWLMADPARILRAVELWDAAAELERQDEAYE